MNETSNPNPESETTANQRSSAGCCGFESLRSALNEGAQQAKAAAEKAAPKIKAAFSDATYCLGFGVSFAAVFSYTLATALAPQAWKAGAREGAQAGKRAAEEFTNHCKPQSTHAEGGAAPSPQTA